MIPLVTGKEMKLLDQNTTAHYGVPEIVLMEQAAQGFVQKLLCLNKKQEHQPLQRALILCGAGNNGADGLAIARLLHEQNIHPVIYPVGELSGGHTTASYQLQRQICDNYRLETIPELPDSCDFDVVIDAIFGIGLTREITGAIADLLQVINQYPCWRVAVDISSGIDADCGAILGTSFCSDDTITFSFGKIGQYLWPGSESSGRVHVVPMGITSASFLEHQPQFYALTQADLAFLPQRKPHSNKGTYGKLLIVAGSFGMAGAAVLSARAAYRSGAGLVRVLTPAENRIVLQTSVPEAIVTTYTRDLDNSAVIQAIRWADAIVVGPGLGTDETSEQILSLILESAEVPVLLDADALNLLSIHPQWLSYVHSDWILTPHLAEMRRLTRLPVARIQSHLTACAQEFSADHQLITVLKDFHTITAIPTGRTYINLSGNPGMATAGSGDVLSGIIGSLLAQGMASELAAPYGVYLHGAAGDCAAKQYSMASMTAGSIIEGLSQIK